MLQACYNTAMGMDGRIVMLAGQTLHLQILAILVPQTSLLLSHSILCLKKYQAVLVTSCSSVYMNFSTYEARCMRTQIQQWLLHTGGQSCWQSLPSGSVPRSSTAADSAEQHAPVVRAALSGIHGQFKDIPSFLRAHFKC